MSWDQERIHEGFRSAGNVLFLEEVIVTQRFTFSLDSNILLDSLIKLHTGHMNLNINISQIQKLYKELLTKSNSSTYSFTLV